MSNAVLAGPLASSPPAGAAPHRTWHLPIDRRMVLAGSGGVMLSFVAAHLAGNLLAFAGSDGFNAYARSLRELGSPLVGHGVALTLVRVVVAGALIAHLGAHVRILLGAGDGTREGPARGGSSAGDGAIAAPYVPRPPTYAAFPLPVFLATGGVMAVFLAFHLAQLTFGAANPAFDRADPYANTIAALRAWPVALAYMAAAAAAGIHLLTGTWTGMRSLRLLRPRTERLARVLAPAIALTVAAGMGAVPTAVLLGVLR
ncbi:MAG TPA: hypothetical protein VFN74_03835 [Chloroflexota bacterium]|nr:hypothetical protein [Chloroflexota bacterium]